MSLLKKGKGNGKLGKNLAMLSGETSKEEENIGEVEKQEEENIAHVEKEEEEKRDDNNFDGQNILNPLLLSSPNPSGQ